MCQHQNAHCSDKRHTTKCEQIKHTTRTFSFRENPKFHLFYTNYRLKRLRFFSRARQSHGCAQFWRCFPLDACSPESTNLKRLTRVCRSPWYYVRSCVNRVRLVVSQSFSPFSIHTVCEPIDVYDCHAMNVVNSMWFPSLVGNYEAKEENWRISPFRNCDVLASTVYWHLGLHEHGIVRVKYTEIRYSISTAITTAKAANHIIRCLNGINKTM